MRSASSLPRDGRRFLAAFVAIVTPLSTMAGSAAADPVLIRGIKADVTFLADDLLEGRAAGTRGHELAIAYVQARFARLGLQPAGDDGFRQRVRLRESRSAVETSRLVLRHASGETALVAVNDCVVRPAPNAAVADLTASAVFVGFGIHAPDYKYDDFAAAPDVRGKIAVILDGSPASLPSTARAHYTREKLAELTRRGAVGVVSLGTPSEERRSPWAFRVNSARFPAMRLVNPDGTLFEEFPTLQARASVSRAAASAFFEQSGRTYDEVIAASEKSVPQAFALNLDLSLGNDATLSDVTSANVLALLPGSDPALAGEPLVMTAHLDHLGIGPAMQGDTIYNGALDNATGVAALLGAADQLAQGGPLRRPVLFAALTAEEKGLLGAYQLSRHPPAGVRRYTATLNLDMPLLLAPTREILPIGTEHSSLGAVLQEVAYRLGFSIAPDLQPEEVFFVRSDQYPFVRAGVPALYFKAGLTQVGGGTDLAERQKDFLKTHYHKPSDDLTRPIDWPSVAAFSQLAAELIRTVANDPQPPTWKPGDFFGEKFGKK